MSNKIVTLGVDMDESLRKNFIRCCRDNDTSASREIRQFIRKYLQQHGQRKLL